MGLFDKGGKNEGDVVRVGRSCNEDGEDYIMMVGTIYNKGRKNFVMRVVRIV